MQILELLPLLLPLALVAWYAAWGESWLRRRRLRRAMQRMKRDFEEAARAMLETLVPALRQAAVSMAELAEAFKRAER